MNLDLYNAAEHPALWFLDHKVQPFPLRDRAKEPAVKWQQYSCTREEASLLNHYGVRLTIGFGCVDTDQPEAEAWVAEHLPATPFMVRTGRGWHRYYRLAVTPERFIHRDGLTIELRSEGQYTVGPGSRHPSGSTYEAADWSWNMYDVPFFQREFTFDDRAPEAGGPSGVRGDGDEYQFPETVSAGERHHELFKLLRSMKGLGADPATAWAAVQLANTYHCQPPLREDHTLKTWFRRGWDNPDRMLDPLGDRKPISLKGMAGPI